MCRIIRRVRRSSKSPPSLSTVTTRRHRRCTRIRQTPQLKASTRGSRAMLTSTATATGIPTTTQALRWFLTRCLTRLKFLTRCLTRLKFPPTAKGSTKGTVEILMANNLEASTAILAMETRRDTTLLHHAMTLQGTKALSPRSMCLSHRAARDTGLEASPSKVTRSRSLKRTTHLSL